MSVFSSFKSIFKNTFFRFLIIFLLFLGFVCTLLYFWQENLIFRPDQLPQNHQFRFSFPVSFEEKWIKIQDRDQDRNGKNEEKIHGLLFFAENTKNEKNENSTEIVKNQGDNQTQNQTHPKNLVFYLHGNAGNLQGWGEMAKIYVQNGWDVFMPDYPGYGKSPGQIHDETQIFRLILSAYLDLAPNYENVIIVGRSIGTGPAAWLAAEVENMILEDTEFKKAENISKNIEKKPQKHSTNLENIINPASKSNKNQLLILETPYYNLPNLQAKKFPLLSFSSFLLKYRFQTNQYLQNYAGSVVIFHGDKDQTIPHQSSLELEKEFLPNQKRTLFILPGVGHNDFWQIKKYQTEMKKILQEFQ